MRLHNSEPLNACCILIRVLNSSPRSIYEIEFNQIGRDKTYGEILVIVLINFSVWHQYRFRITAQKTKTYL